MCNYKTLANNKWGYVVRCVSCKHYHAAFGTTVLRMSADEFHEFVLEVKGKTETYANICNRKVKTIAIDTCSKNIGLIYTYDELSRFYGLLKQAREKLDKEVLFNFCEN